MKCNGCDIESSHSVAIASAAFSIQSGSGVVGAAIIWNWGKTRIVPSFWYANYSIFNRKYLNWNLPPQREQKRQQEQWTISFRIWIFSFSFNGFTLCIIFEFQLQTDGLCGPSAILISKLTLVLYASKKYVMRRSRGIIFCFSWKKTENKSKYGKQNACTANCLRKKILSNVWGNFLSRNIPFYFCHQLMEKTQMA